MRGAKMKLLDFYKEINTNGDISNFYVSTSTKNGGKVFSFISTNYRGILTKKGDKLQGFAKGFYLIEKVEGIPRAQWRHSTKAKQEVEKQHVVNMRKSEFFRVVNDTYEKTSRGKVFKKLIENDELEYNEKKLICILLLLPGYFSDTPNYILEQTKLFYNCCNKCGYSDKDILNLQENFIKKCPSNVSDVFYNDYIFLDSFYLPYNDINFLELYKKSTSVEKEELKEYISNNYFNKSYNCILSKKYKPGGNYTRNTIVDNAIIMYLTKQIINEETTNFEEFITNIILIYKKLFNIRENKVRSFIFDKDLNSSVFHVVFYKIKNIPVPLLTVEKDLSETELKELSLSDSTSLGGIENLGIVSTSLKKLAKLNSGYKCIFDECEMCKYFTAKENNKNYLEIHHLIPREFANDFDNTIEIIENYVALCPNCHRKIHLATDSERKHLINILYNQRKDILEKRGLPIEKEQLYKYYKIDE